MWDKPQLLLFVADLLYALAAILLLYAVLFLVVHLPIFPLREVKVTGKLGHVTREQVQYVVKKELKGNFFTMDLNQARVAFEKLPWVRSVNVHRRWPDRLEVVLEEHEALARWGTMALVNTKGELFRAASNADLPVFVGPDGSQAEITERYRVFGQYLAPLHLKPVRVVLSARRAWEVQLNNGLTLALGREQMEMRLAKFVGVYERTVARIQTPVHVVDLRYPNGFAVRVPEFKSREKGGPGEVKKAA
jgi:cell division protein FtsQ